MPTSSNCTNHEMTCPEIVSLYIKNARFTGNQVQLAGSALIVSNPYIVEVECDTGSTKSELIDFSNNGGFEVTKITQSDKNSLFSIGAKGCDNWINNKVSNSEQHQIFK